jgi:ArsR family transcriptional regulator
MADSVRLLKALADETRLRILNLLCRRELCVCQIVEVLGMGQSKVSRHLACLRNADLVADRREALWVHYSLAKPAGRLHQQVIEWLKHAEDEIPLAAEDHEALADLDKCGDLCSEGSSGKGETRRESAATVGS